MSKKFIPIFLFFLLLPVHSLAKNVAVLETISQDSLLTLQEKQYLTDVLTSQAVTVLPAEQNWTVMARENTAADFVAQARISQVGSSFAISVELYETVGNKLVSSFNGRGETVGDIEKIIKEQTPEFFKKVLDSTGNNSSDFDFQENQRFIVEIETTPSGAIPSVDGKAFPKCTSTPCKIMLDAGEHRLVLSKDLFEDKDTVVNIAENNQKILLTLLPNMGSLDLRPSIQENFAQYPIVVTIDGEKGIVGNNDLTPGIHEVKIEHSCYDPMTFNVAVEKGKIGTFRDSLKRGLGGLVLDVYQGGEPQSVPVYFDGAKIGMTPFSGKVPLCTRVEVGEGDYREDVAVALKWHDVVKVTHEMKVRDTWTVVDQAPSNADSGYGDFDENRPVEPAKPPQKDPPQKRFWAGAFVAATYNDFYGTKFGFENLESGDDYTLKVEGADDVLGNYWGVGGNIGVSGLYLFTDYLGLHADLGVVYRHGSGKSDVTVKVYWEDVARVPEKSDLEIDYHIDQLNIDIPLALRVLLPGLIYAEVGPMMSFNLYSKCKFDIDDEFGTQNVREKNTFKVAEFDLISGVGVMRPIGKSFVDFNLRFVLGISPLNDANDPPKTWQWQFNVAYWFI